jgi:hypothetical protein
MAELMSRVGLGDGLGALGQGVAGKHDGQRGIVPAVQAQPQFVRQAPVEEQQYWRWHALGLARLIEAGQVAGVGVVEGDGVDRHGAHFWWR